MHLPQRRLGLWTIACIVALGAILRLIMIDQSYIDMFGWRESDTAGFARNFLIFDANIFVPHLIWNGPGPQPTGYEFQTVSYLASLLYRVFGEHDAIGRLISVAFGTWKLMVFYLLVRRVWNSRLALAAAGILAIMPGEVFVDRLFLPEPAMSSLVITSVWAVVAYLQDGRRRFLIIACATGMLGLLTKISGGIVVVPLLYAIVVHERQRRRERPGAPSLGRTLVIAAAAVLVPVVGYYSWALYLGTKPPFYVAAGDYWIWKHGFLMFLSHNYFAALLFDHLRWIWTLPLILAILGGLLVRPKGTPLPWFFHAWLVGMGMFYAIAAKGLVDNPTNLNLLNPAGAALGGHMLVKLWEAAVAWGGRRLAIAALSIWAILFVQQAIHGLSTRAYYPWNRVDRELGLQLDRLAKPDDLVVTSSHEEINIVAVYYSRRRGWVFPSLFHWLAHKNETATDAQAIELIEDLRGRGADWYGVVATQSAKFQTTRPKFLRHLSRYRRYSYAEFAIYDLNQRVAPKTTTGSELDEP